MRTRIWIAGRDFAVKRRRLLISGVIVLPLIAFVGWWYDSRVPPFRPPELAGRVALIREHDNYFEFLLKQDNPTDYYWVYVNSDTRILNKKWGLGTVVVGQRVKVWFSGGISKTYPGAVEAEWVVIESP